MIVPLKQYLFIFVLNRKTANLKITNLGVSTAMDNPSVSGMNWNPPDMNYQRNTGTQ